MKDSLEKHTAGSQSLGFDYQFLYFVYSLLDLKQGEKIGYEVKDDIHIEKSDGTIVLMQAKHTVQKNSKGKAINMTTLDDDMWKTLSIWASNIFSMSESETDKYKFIIVTNKNNSNNNDLINGVELFQKKGNTIQQVKTIIAQIKNNTTNEKIQGYINDVLQIADDKLDKFLSRIEFQTSTDNLIEEITERLKERLFQNKADKIDMVMDSLFANLSKDKYIKIDNQGSFEITFEDFCSKYERCFRLVFDEKPLPIRKFSFHLPNNIEDKVFIQQLLDIGDINSGSSEIEDYATLWFQAFNNFQNWIENSFVLSSEIDDFEKNAIRVWKNEFKSKYRTIEHRLSAGETINDLDKEIKSLALELLDFIRKEKLSLANTDLGIEISNGYYYLLSDEPKIGWHYDWKNRYAKP
jgi:hypothetical protein